MFVRGSAPAPRVPPPPPPRPSGGGFLGNIGASLVHTAPAIARAPARTMPYQPPRGGGSDAATSGPGYGSPEANAYKQTPAYKQAVVQVFKAQPPPQQKAIVQGALRNPTAEGKLVLQYVKAQQTANSLTHESGLGHLLGVGAKDLYSLAAKPLDFQAGATGARATPVTNAIGHVGDLGLKGLNSAVYGLQSIGGRPAEGNLTASGISGGVVARVAPHAAIDVARAAIQDPIGVGAKTLKGFGDTVVGSVAGAAQLPIRAVQEGPGKALSQLGHQIGQDYTRRYGPLAAGNDRAFINRIKKEGATPEAFDAFALAGGLDATAGRAISSAAKAKAALTGQENFLTRARPDLLLSGNKTRAQEVAATAGRATAQRIEDYLRSKRHGELTPKVNQVAPLFQSHAIRVVHSGVAQRWRRVLQENLAREVRGRLGSANHAIGKLNHWQKQAVYHAIHGVRVDTAANFRADLAARYHQIEQDRLNPASLGNRIPVQHADKVDELALIDRLIPHADKIVGPRMVAFQKGEAARAQRIEALTNLHPATAEARRLRPVGDRLGIEHPDVAMARAEAAAQQTARHAAADARTAPRASSAPASGKPMPGRPSFGGELGAARSANHAEALAQLPRTERLAKYVGEVRAKMAEHGLPEPGYFKHSERPDVKFGDYTAGQGARAMPADKVSTWALHRAGVADHSPQAYLNGLARSVKRPLQWRLTDEQFRHAYLGTPTAQEIKQALGENKAAHLLTGNELRRVLEHQGVDLKNVSFVNPGRLAERTLADHQLLPRSAAPNPAKRGVIAKVKATEAKGRDQFTEPNQLAQEEFRQALKQDDTVQHGDANLSDRFLTTPGWKAVPRTAFDEINGNLKGNSLGGRLVGKVQGTSAGLILGQNPHFLIMNTLAHAIPAIAGTKGRILPDLLKTPLWWHGLTNAEKDRSRMFEAGRAGHYNATARLGSQAPNQIAASGRRLSEHGIVQKTMAVNPLHAILKAEDLQSNFFRHAVMYHELKRAAFQDMAHEYGHAVALWEQVKHVFTLGPTDRMKALMENMPKMEELGRTAVNILGDYGRFTNRERQFLNNKAVLFYSFLRHVTRTLLYVLPARHPLAFGLMGEIGNLHVEEVKKLLGGQDLPWAYGRMFFDKGNKLRSIDMTSTSPISSPLVDILSGGAKQIPRLVSPALAPLLDVAYGQTPIGTPVQRNAMTYLNDLLSLSYPYRAGSAAHFGLKPQQSDSIPFLHEHPKVLKTAKAQAYQNAKTQARGPLKDYLLGTTLGLYPKPDDSRVIAEHMAQVAASKGKGRGRHRNAIPRGGGSFGGGFGGDLSGGGLSGGGI